MDLEYYKQYLENTLGIPNVNFEGLDIDTAKEITEALIFILNKYPAMKKTICSIGDSEYINNQMNLLRFINNPQAKWEDNKDNSTTSMAICTLQIPKQILFKFIKIAPITQFVGLQYGILLENIDQHNKKVETAVNNGYLTKFTSSLKGITYHEIGHVLDTILGISHSEELHRILSLKNWNIMKEIDIAAGLSMEELVAEAFSEYISNPEPSELVSLIGSLIDKKYNEKKESWLFEVNYRYKKHLERANNDGNKKSR